jgi:pyrroline-5-carboxylate reductase
MADGAVKMGLNRDMALRLCMQTMKGAGELMISQHGKKHPMALKDEVCSPGGTTIQGVCVCLCVEGVFYMLVYA